MHVVLESFLWLAGEGDGTLCLFFLLLAWEARSWQKACGRSVQLQNFVLRRWPVGPVAHRHLSSS